MEITYRINLINSSCYNLQTVLMSYRQAANNKLSVQIPDFSLTIRKRFLTDCLRGQSYYICRKSSKRGA